MKLEIRVVDGELLTVGPILLVVFEVGKGGTLDITELRKLERVMEDIRLDVEVSSFFVLLGVP